MDDRYRQVRLYLKHNLYITETKQWQSGFFDKNTFQEILSPWAQTVVVGRARLGGVPMGVVSVETRTVELAIPADPANSDSEAKVGACCITD